jgi:hypothetical protein
MRNAILLLLMLVVGLPVFGDSDMTKITIKVVDENGKPIDRANVRLKFKQGRRKSTAALVKINHSWELKTTQEGVAELPPIPKGDVLVQVTAQGRQSFGDTLTIDQDQKTIDVVLKKPQRQYSVHGDKDPRTGDERTK